MNKKILSILVMVMALSLLGVSCNKKTTDPTNDNSSGGGKSMLGLAVDKKDESSAADLSFTGTVDGDNVAPAGAAIDVTCTADCFSPDIQTAGKGNNSLITYTVIGTELFTESGTDIEAGNQAAAAAVTKDSFVIAPAGSAAYNKFSINVDANAVDTIQTAFGVAKTGIFIVTMKASVAGYDSVSFPIYVKIKSAAQS